MTRRFLDMFFQGSWSNYGHFSATMIWAFIIGPIGALIIMTIWELIQWKWDSGWCWNDILYNISGALAYLLVTEIKAYIL
jgi:hypothetical protein